jgi:hypothetical protein
LTDLIFGHPIDAARARFLLCIVPFVFAVKCARPVAAIAALPLILALGLLRSLVRLLDPNRAISRYLGPLVRDARALSTVAAGLLSAQSNAGVWFRQFRCLRRFARDTCRLLRKLDLTENDVVFVPTVSAIELMALSRVLAHPSRRPGPSWHLVFRRNICEGRESDYRDQEPSLEPLRQVFTNAGRRLCKARVFCYTDTDELTAQYARLNAFDFRTLPIPHTTTPPAAPPTFPLRVVYCGDARGEKGYHFLPRIVRAVWPDYVETGKLHFTVQSNYNIPNGEPRVVIARSQLQALPDDKVTLLTEPLSSTEYRRLIESGDINLLLYDRDNYYARSSGILIESLACGIPVIVPSGTWLARQFLPQLYAHQEALRDQLPPVRTVSGDTLCWFSHGTEAPLDASRSGQLDTAEKACAWIRVPERAAALVLSATLDSSCKEALLLFTQSGPNGETLCFTRRLVEAEPVARRAVSVVSIHKGAAKIWLAVQAVRHEDRVCFSQLRLDFLPAGLPFPLGAVGLVYDDVEEVPQLLSNMVDHYEHYRRTARALAPAIYSHHNGDELIRLLADAASAPLSEPLLAATFS